MVSEMALKTHTACFTGHRKIPPERLNTITRRLRAAIIELIENGYLYFGAGVALVFDTLAAQTILDLKLEYPQIKLILVLPCISQSSRWNEQEQVVYEDIKARADKVVYTSHEYIRGCMHKRNRHLVDNSSACICYLTDVSGGTAYTVEYAKRNKLRVINIAEK